MVNLRLPALFLLAYSFHAQSPPADLERARKFVAEGRLDDAIAIYEAALESRPADPALILNLAVVEFKARRYEHVIERCRKLLELTPDSAPASLFLGASYFELGKPAAAIEPLQKAVQALPNDRNSRLMLAESLLLVERYSDAAEHFHVASRLLPESPRVWYGLERSFFWLGEQARAELERSAPDSAYAYALAGDTFLRRQQYGRACHYLQKALAADPQIRQVHASLAAVYRATGHPDWAQQEEEAEAKLGAPDCNRSRAACDFAAGRYQEIALSAGNAQEALYWRAKASYAVTSQAYDRLEALPPSSELHELKARRLDSRARYLEAASEWKQALALTPDSAVLEKGLAVSLLNGRDLTAAVPLLEKVLKQEPDPELEFLLGTSMLQLEQPLKAIAYLESALKHRTDFPQARGALGEAYLKAGEPSKAILHLEAARASDEDGTRHFQLSRAYQAAGERERATQALEQYKRLRRESEIRRKELETDYPISAPPDTK